MNRSPQTIRHYTPHATLAAVGVKIRSLKLFDTIKEHVFIRQKTVRHTPVEKLHQAEAQDMLILLNQLARNVLVWARSWLCEESPQLIRYGVLRFVRDLLSISGLIEVDRRGTVNRIVLNRGAPFARGLLSALRVLLLPEQVVIILDKI